MRTYVYVDGFNLYYRALRRTSYKWLDLLALSKSLLASENEILHIRYFTAPVSGKEDPEQPIRQRRYLRALTSLPNLTIHQGTFLTMPKLRPLVNALPGQPTHVEVMISEEKGSDVNLASFLIHDAWRDLYDVAIIFSQDTDLLEPVRIVRDEIGKTIGMVVLDGRNPNRLSRSGTFLRHLTHARLAAAQFPEDVLLKNGKTVSRPENWA